jgi:hypothetical protein
MFQAQEFSLAGRRIVVGPMLAKNVRHSIGDRLNSRKVVIDKFPFNV